MKKAIEGFACSKHKTFPKQRGLFATSGVGEPIRVLRDLRRPSDETVAQLSAAE